jgi:hypothetical protein
MLHPDTNLKFNRCPLKPEGTATDRNLMYDGNMPSNRITLTTNLIKIRQIFEKILGETHVSMYHTVKTKLGTAHVDKHIPILNI